MGYALVGSLGAVASSGSPSFGQATTAGNLLIAWLGGNDGGSTNPFTTSSPGWTILTANGGAFNWSAIAYKANCGANETAPTFGMGSSSTPFSMLGEFSGGATASPLDQTGTGSGSTVQTAQCSAADGQGGDLIIGVVYWNSPGGTQTASNVLTDSSGATVTANTTSAQPGGAGTVVYDFVWGIAGSTLGASGDKLVATLTAFSSGTSGIASFKPAAGGAAAVPPLPLASPGRTWLRRFRHRQAPLFTSTFSVSFTDSGTGADTLSAGNVSTPLPAVAGKTWRRQFKHRQAPLYTSTFSTDLADSGAGADALAPGIASAYPFPPAIPGQTWLRRFRHRQQPLYTSTFSVPLADSGTGADTFNAAIINPPLPAVAGQTWLRQFKHRQAYPYIPLQVNVSAIGLSDSGTGLDTFSAAVINPPLPAVPGRTWLRNFKHRQLPLYTSTFSEDFTDSGAGADTLAPGIATAYPFPPATPGQAWQRQYKHRQQALYTSTYSRDLTDSGTGTDSLTPGPVFSNPLFPATPGRTWARRFKHPQTYPYLPVPANTFSIGLTDSGTGTDTFAASISTTLPLTLRTGKTWLRQFKHPQVPLYTSTFSEDFSDSGAGTDTLAITSGVALSDTGAGTDTLSPGVLNPPLPAAFGKTWLRNFKHRQAPLYTSTFSENLADSGAGADVLGVTVTAVLPVPLYLRPGKTWLRRYKHRQIPLYTLAYSINPARQAVFAAGQIATDWQLGLVSTDWQIGQASTDWQLGLVSSR